MPSTFQNLFSYARSTQVEAKENFTTEVLAACIRSDPGPMLAALEHLGILEQATDMVEVVARTQVARPGAGIIDLMLQLRAPDRVAEVWFEVKVESGESGRQLDAYRSYIAVQPSAVRPALVTLAKAPIRADPYERWLPWQVVRTHAKASPHPYWRDLATFLKEIHMADDYDAPVTSREAASLSDAVRLRGKVRRILWPLLQEAPRDFPGLPVPRSEDELKKNIAVWFRNRGRYVTVLGDDHRKGCWLSIGVWPGDDEAELGVAVHSDPKLTASRSSLLALADAGGLPPAWARQLAGWEALANRRRLVTFPDHAAAREWLHERLVELDRTGIIAVMPEIPLEPAGPAT